MKKSQLSLLRAGSLSKGGGLLEGNMVEICEDDLSSFTMAVRCGVASVCIGLELARALAARMGHQSRCESCSQRLGEGSW